MNDTDHPKDVNDHTDQLSDGLPISHFVHAISSYKHVILRSLIGVGIAYAVVALVILLFGPSQGITAVPFRLDFRGASEGAYPNGLRFSPAEIVREPLLLRVYKANHLERFVQFSAFSRSVFVLESNPEFEKLAVKYAAQLADTKLLADERARIENDFEMKRRTLTHNNYALAYMRSGRWDTIPESLVRKVLGDILYEWATFAVREQSALEYRISVISPQIFTERPLDPNDYVRQIALLRSRIYQVQDNIMSLSAIPGAELARTKPDNLSLLEIQIRLMEIIRYNLEPLVGMVSRGGLIADPQQTIHFLEDQLAFDRRRLDAVHVEANGARESVALYFMEKGATTASSAGAVLNPGNTRSPRGTQQAGETVMPQLSDTFLDRLITLSSESTDATYRQRLVDVYRSALQRAAPLEEAVGYDTQILDEVRGAAAGSGRADPAAVRQTLAEISSEVRYMVVKLDLLYQSMWMNLNPPRQLFTITGVTITRTERQYGLPFLALCGVGVMILALIVIVVLCLAHNRLREEELAEHYVAETVAT
jgi:hypothetical protein